jgi:hypothetical protein
LDRKENSMVDLPADGNKYVLVCKEKHGTRYYDATSPEAYVASCNKILKERFEDGWTYEKWDDPPMQYSVILTPEEIEKLPEHLRVQEQKKLDTWNQEVQEHKNHNANCDAIEKFLQGDLSLEKPVEVTRKSDGQLLRYTCTSARILALRKHYQYEEVKVERME